MISATNATNVPENTRKVADNSAFRSWFLRKTENIVLRNRLMNIFRSRRFDTHLETLETFEFRIEQLIVGLPEIEQPNSHVYHRIVGITVNSIYCRMLNPAV